MDVISLVSSDEEDNGHRRLKNKSITIKKLKTKDKQIENKIPAQKTASTVARAPNNNNIKSNITVLHGLKQQKLPIVQSKDGKTLECHKPGNLLSGVTITSIKDVVTANSHGKLNNTSNTSLITANPKTDAMIIIPKTNAPSVSPPKNVVVNLVSPAKPSKSTKPPKPAKRIHPVKISDAITIRASSIEKSNDSDVLSRDSSTVPNDESVPEMMRTEANGTNQCQESNQPPKRPTVDSNQNQKTPINEEYKELINACKAAESSDEMKKIVIKLIKYYQQAHPDYVNSKSFRKLVKNLTNEINAQPSMVYFKITSLMEELRTRRTADNVSVTDKTSTEPEVDEKKAKKVQRLSEALRILQKKIRKCEEAEVDWDDEYNSRYLMTERYKKRACQIYEKLCDLTGESRNAERIVKKPIKFRGTKFPEFNRKLEKFVNDTKSFPDMFDVLRIIDHCNQHYGYRLTRDSRQTVAQDAFTHIGNLLQERRKKDLYEMVQYYTSNHNDPAREDASLKMKLEENHKHYSKRMNEVIQKYTMRQDRESSDDEEEQSPAKSKEKPGKSNTNNKKVPTTSAVSSSAQMTRKSAPAPHSVPIKMDADLDINDDDIEMIIPDGDGDGTGEEALRLIDDDEMQEIENDLFPTITSVTSLHPNHEPFNDLFETSSLGNSNIL